MSINFSVWQRFQEQVLEVTYKGLNVDDLLTKSIEEVFDFFNQEPDKHKKLLDKLKALMDVGLGYMPLGQSSSTISGGEAQRIKLAFYLVKSGPSKKTLFIFDEPTTGLHFHDVNILIHAMGKLIDEGHSIWMIEHHPDMIKSADYIIDLGPEGGEKGGEIIFQGKMDDFLNCKHSYTSQFLNKKTL
jgi:excinuclease ABC subunit A